MKFETSSNVAGKGFKALIHKIGIHKFNYHPHLSDVPGLEFSGFGWAQTFMYRASGELGFFVSGLGLFSGFSKV